MVHHRSLPTSQIRVHFFFAPFYNVFLTWLFPPCHTWLSGPQHTLIFPRLSSPESELLGSYAPLLLLVSRYLKCVIEPYFELCSLGNSFLNLHMFQFFPASIVASPIPTTAISESPCVSPLTSVIWHLDSSPKLNKTFLLIKSLWQFAQTHWGHLACILCSIFIYANIICPG